MSEKIFANGLIYKAPLANAPEFIKGRLAIKTDEFIQLLKDQKSDWVNIDLKISKNGKLYAEVNTWKKESTEDRVEYPSQGDDKDLLF